MLTYSLLKMKREKTIMKLTGKKIKSMLLCMMLAMAFTVAGCGSKTESIETAEAQEIVLGDGSVKITVIVVDADGNETNFVVSTDKETVGDALLELNLIEGDDSEYGLYVKTVNGITADYDTDGTYWAFYVNGEYASTGVDSTPVNEGDTYEFKVEK